MHHWFFSSEGMVQNIEITIYIKEMPFFVGCLSLDDCVRCKYFIIKLFSLILLCTFDTLATTFC